MDDGSRQNNGRKWVKKTQSLQAECRKMIVFRGQQEGTKRFAKTNSIKGEIRVELPSRPRVKTVKKTRSPTVDATDRKINTCGRQPHEE